jgi:hypothetical protein
MNMTHLTTFLLPHFFLFFLLARGWGELGWEGERKGGAVLLGAGNAILMWPTNYLFKSEPVLLLFCYCIFFNIYIYIYINI